MIEGLGNALRFIKNAMEFGDDRDTPLPSATPLERELLMEDVSWVPTIISSCAVLLEEWYLPMDKMDIWLRGDGDSINEQEAFLK